MDSLGRRAEARDAQAAQAPSQDSTSLERGQTEERAALPTEASSSPTTPSAEGQPQRFTLRPYQEECIQSCLAALRSPDLNRIGVSSPTASGKTAIFTHLIERLPALDRSDLKEAPHTAHRVLIIVGSVELATQAAASVRRFHPELVVEVEQGKNAASGEADVTVATYQTLAYSDFQRLSKFDPLDYKAVIVDEAHHAASKSYLRILAHFDPRIDNTTVDENYDEAQLTADPPAASSTERELRVAPGTVSDKGEPCVPILGFSATFGRADGLALGKVFQRIVFSRDWLDMIRDGWLSDLAFTVVHLGKSLRLDEVEVSDATGEYKSTSLAEAVLQPHVTELIIRAWLAHAARDGRRSTLVFAVNIDHVVALTNAFRDVGVEARHVFNGTPPRERDALLAAFKRREFPVLVNCAVLTEGADFPAIDCVMLARPTRSQNLLMQMLGRGLRLSPETGKKNCLVLDFIGNTTRGVACTPTLFGFDPAASVEGQTVNELESLSSVQPYREEQIVSEAESSSDLSSLLPDSLHFTEYETVFDLVESQNGRPRLISHMSPFAWVGVGDGDKYVLTIMKKGNAIIRRSDKGGWEASFQQMLPFWASSTAVKYRPLAHIGSHHDLSTLVRTADAWITNWLGGSQSARELCHRFAHWRNRPASSSQQSFIKTKLGWDDKDDECRTISGVWVGQPPTVRIALEDLKKGQAADIITRLINGGLGEWRKRSRKIETQLRRRRKA